jgi:tetratricopeptide (TPR) repeat protein
MTMGEQQAQKISGFDELEQAINGGDFRRALQLLPGLMAIYPERPEFVILTLKCYLGLGRPLRALMTARKSTQDVADNPQLLELMRVIHHELLLDDRAMQIARQLVQTGVASEDTYDYFARSLLDSEDAVKAASVIAVGLAKYPNSDRLKHAKSLVHLKLGERDEALAISEELTDQGSPLGPEISSLIARGRSAPGRQASDDVAQKAREHMKAATDLLAKGDPEAAACALIAAIRLDENLALAYTRLGYVYNHCGLHDESGDFHRKAIEKDPTLVEAYRNLAYSSYKKGDFKQALDTYEKALEVDPGCVELHNSIGVIYDKLGNHAEAITHYQQALQLNPEAEATRRNLGFAYQAEGRVDEAIAAYERAITIDPDSSARINLATLYRMVHRYSDAKEILCAITEKKPESLTAWLELALCHKGLNENGKYGEAFEKAKGLPPKSAPEAFTKAQLMELLDERTAYDYWKAYVAMAGDAPHEARRTSYAKDRIGALGTRLGLTSPSAYIIGEGRGNEFLPSATG